MIVVAERAKEVGAGTRVAGAVESRAAKSTRAVESFGLERPRSNRTKAITRSYRSREKIIQQKPTDEAARAGDDRVHVVALSSRAARRPSRRTAGSAMRGGGGAMRALTLSVSAGAW